MRFLMKWTVLGCLSTLMMDINIDGSVGVLKNLNCETHLPDCVNEAKKIMGLSHPDHTYYLTTCYSEFLDFACSIIWSRNRRGSNTNYCGNWGTLSHLWISCWNGRRTQLLYRSASTDYLLSNDNYKLNSDIAPLYYTDDIALFWWKWRQVEWSRKF